MCLTTLRRLACGLALSFVLEVALSAQTDDAKLHFGIAEAALKKGDLSVAAEEMELAVHLDPNNAVLWYNLAVVQSKQHQITKANKTLETAFKLGIPAEDKDAAIELKGSISYEMRDWSNLKKVIGAWVARSQSEWEKPSRSRGVSCHGATAQDEQISLRFDEDEGALTGTYILSAKYIDKNQSWNSPASDDYHEECRKLYERSVTGRLDFKLKAHWDPSSRSIKHDASVTGGSGCYSDAKDKQGIITLDSEGDTLGVTFTDWGITKYKRVP